MYKTDITVMGGGRGYAKVRYVSYVGGLQSAESDKPKGLWYMTKRFVGTFLWSAWLGLADEHVLYRESSSRRPRPFFFFVAFSISFHFIAADSITYVSSFCAFNSSV